MPLHGYAAPGREILFCSVRGLGSGTPQTADFTGAILVSLAQILLLRQKLVYSLEHLGLWWELVDVS